MAPRKVLPGTVPWLAIETAVRDALRDYASGDTLALSALRIIDEAIAIGTGRGNVLPENALPWEPSSDIDRPAVETRLAKIGLRWSK